MPIFFGDRPDGGPVFPASGQSTPPPPPAPSTSGVGGSSGGDGGSAPPPSSPSQPAKQHPVQPRPAQAPPLNIPGSYHPGRVQPATRAHPTRALANVMHQGGGITAATTGASMASRPKTHVPATRLLALQTQRRNTPTPRAAAADGFNGTWGGRGPASRPISHSHASPSWSKGLRENAGDIVSAARGPQRGSDYDVHRLIDYFSNAWKDEVEQIRERLREGGLGGGVRPDLEE